MIRIAGGIITAVAVWSIASAPLIAQPAAPVAQAAPVTIHQQVSRTAVWPGDSLVYTVEVTCPPGTDILPEDLGSDRLRLQGLELSSMETDRQARPDGTVVYRARFHLASYSLENPVLRIEPMRVRYYLHAPGQRIENSAPAGEAEAPAVEIALRSTLRENELPGIRDIRAPLQLPAAVRFLRPIAITAVVLSFVPVLLGLAAFIARRRAARGSRPTRRRPEQDRAALEEIRQLGSATGASRLEAFDRLDNLVRQYLVGLDLPAHSLTPDELRDRAAQHPGLRADQLASLLRECQRARYGGPDQLPDAAALDRALDQAGELLASRVR